MTSSEGNTHHSNAAGPAHASDHPAHADGGEHDEARRFKESYKRYYSNPRTVANLLANMDSEAGAPPELVAAFDLASLERVPEDIVPREVQERIGDCLWQVRLRGPVVQDGPSPSRAMVILVFEETFEPDSMAHEMSECIDALWSAVLRSRDPQSKEPPPLLVPVLKVVEKGRWSRPPAATLKGTPVDDPGS